MEKPQTYPDVDLCCVLNPEPFKDLAQPGIPFLCCVYCGRPICFPCANKTAVMPRCEGYYHHAGCMKVCPHTPGFHHPRPW